MFALVDCNSFYASCEQIFRPDLRNKPVVVLSNNDGCIVARSKEAKALNIPELSPFFQIEAQLKQQNVHIFSSNYPLYGDISNRVMLTLSQFSPSIEVYSIDEMFLDFGGLSVDLKTYSHNIKNTLWQHIRMPVGIGVAQTKTLAKLANHAAKKIPKCNGVCVLDSAEKQTWLLKRTSISSVWGVGKKSSLKLSRYNIKTAWDLSLANRSLIRKIGGVTLERTACELTGKNCLQLEEVTNKKNIISSRSFGKKVTLITDLNEAIATYCARALKKLNAQKQHVKTLYIFLKTSPYEPNFYQNSGIINLPYPTNDIRIITQYAKHALKAIYKQDKHYLKLGVGFVELVEMKSQQMDMLSNTQPEKSNRLMSTLEDINRKFGTSTIKLAAQGNKHSWEMRQAYLSQAYTTQWNSLPTVK